MSKATGLGPDKATGETETLLEVTDWEYPNHTYLVDKGKGWLLGYRNVLTGKVKIYSKPMKQFSKSRRKFKRVVDKELSQAYTV